MNHLWWTDCLNSGSSPSRLSCQWSNIGVVFPLFQVGIGRDSELTGAERYDMASTRSCIIRRWHTKEREVQAYSCLPASTACTCNLQTVRPRGMYILEAIYNGYRHLHRDPRSVGAVASYPNVSLRLPTPLRCLGTLVVVFRSDRSSLWEKDALAAILSSHLPRLRGSASASFYKRIALDLLRCWRQPSLHQMEASLGGHRTAISA